jgi:hypothetical protein
MRRAFTNNYNKKTNNLAHMMLIELLNAHRSKSKTTLLSSKSLYPIYCQCFCRIAITLHSSQRLDYSARDSKELDW